MGGVTSVFKVEKKTRSTIYIKRNAHKLTQRASSLDLLGMIHWEIGDRFFFEIARLTKSTVACASRFAGFYIYKILYGRLMINNGGV